MRNLTYHLPILLLFFVFLLVIFIILNNFFLIKKFFFVVLGMVPRSSCMLSMCSITELQPSLHKSLWLLLSQEIFHGILTHTCERAALAEWRGALEPWKSPIYSTVGLREPTEPCSVDQSEKCPHDHWPMHCPEPVGVGGVEVCVGGCTSCVWQWTSHIPSASVCPCRQTGMATGSLATTQGHWSHDQALMHMRRLC